MIKFSKTNWLIIPFAILIVATGFFAYQWWQTKGKLAKKIEENENLIKQVNELQAEIDRLQTEIEELKISEEKIKDETAGWRTYRNEKQGFEIKFPSEWNYFVSEDKIKNDHGIFHIGFTGEGTSFSMEINRHTSPPSPSFPLCIREREFTILKSTFSKTLSSSFQAGFSEEECDKFLLDEHLIHSQFCIDEKLKVYPPTLEQGVAGYFLSCEKGNLYNFSLFCEGEKWQGKEGRDKCSALFDQIVSTFRFIKE